MSDTLCVSPLCPDWDRHLQSATPTSSEERRPFVQEKSPSAPKTKKLVRGEKKCQTQIISVGNTLSSLIGDLNCQQMVHSTTLGQTRESDHHCGWWWGGWWSHTPPSILMIRSDARYLNPPMNAGFDLTSYFFKKKKKGEWNGNDLVHYLTLIAILIIWCTLHREQKGLLTAESSSEKAWWVISVVVDTVPLCCTPVGNLTTNSTCNNKTRFPPLSS